MSKYINLKRNSKDEGTKRGICFVEQTKVSSLKNEIMTFEWRDSITLCKVYRNTGKKRQTDR